MEPDVLLRYAKDNYDSKSIHFNRLIKILNSLIDQGEITVVHDMNPHIKRYPDVPKEQQHKYLKEHFDQVGLYPTRKTIESNTSDSQFQDLPFKRRLLLGEPQIYPLYFELQILEHYANDPRFDFRFSDYTGHISITNEHYEAEATLNRDKVFIEHFGIGYQKLDKKRVAVAWLCDLANLSSEHQHRWESFIIHDPCIMDPDFYENQVKGNWTEKVSIYSAILTEIEMINKFCDEIGWPQLFKNNFKERPKNFRMPFLSTSEQYYKFVGVIDKIFSENINKDFFNHFLSPEEQVDITTHGKTGLETVRDYGTIKLLEVWLKKSIKLPEEEQEDFLKIFKVLKKIRDHRSKDAHRIQDNLHSIEYDKMHDQIVNDSYSAIQGIRLLLTNHPKIKSRAQTLIPDWLYDGNIRTFYFYKLD